MTHINTGIHRGKSFNALNFRCYKRPKTLLKKLLKSKIKNKLPYGFDVRDVLCYDSDLYFWTSDSFEYLLDYESFL